jgi:S-adenosylmethionine hydrolase
MGIITLLTDFGHDNWFVGTMKGVIKSVSPTAEIVDICHEVAGHAVAQAAFVLRNACPYFPPGTVHCAVVDPGVGSERAAIIVETDRARFVAPDNGVLSAALEDQAIKRIVRIEEERYMLTPVSRTFHARDVFAPVAAHLDAGVKPDKFGARVEDFVRLARSTPRKLSDAEAVGHILHVDRFGNLITDLHETFLAELLAGARGRYFRLQVRDHEVRRLVGTYAEGRPGELVALVGSSGYLEIAVNRGSARDTVDIHEGGEFILKVL